jgi:hypothetical protein
MVSYVKIKRSHEVDFPFQVIFIVYLKTHQVFFCGSEQFQRCGIANRPSSVGKIYQSMT